MFENLFQAGVKLSSRDECLQELILVLLALWWCERQEPRGDVTQLRASPGRY